LNAVLTPIHVLFTLIHAVWTLIHVLFTLIHAVLTPIHVLFTLIHAFWTLIHVRWTLFGRCFRLIRHEGIATILHAHATMGQLPNEALQLAVLEQAKIVAEAGGFNAQVGVTKYRTIVTKYRTIVTKYRTSVTKCTTGRDSRASHPIPLKPQFNPSLTPLTPHLNPI